MCWLFFVLTRLRAVSATHERMLSNPMDSPQPQKVQLKKDFDEAAFAYTVLSTPEQRQLYDELGEVHCCYTVVTLLLHCCYTVVALLLHCWYTVVILLLHCCYTVATLLLHCCYTVVTL
jgi:hypothetical protein